MNPALNDLALALPTKVEPLVDLLIEEDCRGYRRSACRCPVAVYFARHVAPPGHTVSVFDLRRFADLPRGAYKIGMDIVVLPDSVGEFIRRFDAGEFPQLVADYHYETGIGGGGSPVEQPIWRMYNP